MTKKNITITILLILVIAIGIGIAIGIAKSKISIASAKEPRLVPFKELRVAVLRQTVALPTKAMHLDKAPLNTSHDLLNTAKDTVASSALKNNLKPVELKKLGPANVLDLSKQLDGKTLLVLKNELQQVKGVDVTKQVNGSKLLLATKHADQSHALDLTVKGYELKLTAAAKDLSQAKAVDSVKAVHVASLLALSTHLNLEV
jgi:hypothetical protein